MPFPDPSSVALARAIYEQEHRTGPVWRDLSHNEQDRWIARAGEIGAKLDTLGWRLTFIPPEG